MISNQYMQDHQIQIKKTFLISLALTKDFNSMLEIERELKLPITSFKLFKRLIEQKNILILKNFLLDEILAFVQFQGDIAQIDIISIGVKKKWQNNGLAKIMIKCLIEKGYEKIYLEVSKFNAPALKLYYSLGFKKVYVRKQYYTTIEKIKEDAFILKYEKYNTIYKQRI